MKPERVAIYARVSTVAGQHVEMQLVELQEYAARRGWQVFGEYVDHASGAKESRPALNRLMTDARQRKFDVIAVWKLDRFGRSLRHLVNAIAEFERSLIQERVKAGLRHAKQKGKRLGRPRVIVDAERIGLLRASGASWRTISEKLGVGIGTLYKAVQPRSEKVSPAAPAGR